MPLVKTCTASGKTFEITDQDLEFYKKMDVPPPTLCPEAREQRRESWSNQMHLFHRTCDGTGKKIISNHAPDSGVKVYDVQHFFTDNWDQTASGRDFDFSRPFFEQFQELIKDAPIPALQRSPEYDHNSEFTNYAGKNKNCYLIFDSDKNQDCSYSYSINDSVNCTDNYRLDSCQLCYESIDCTQCYDSRFLQNCSNCSTSWFLKNCIGCADCFGSVNLRNKQYYFLNEKCTKEQYEKKLAELDLNTYPGLLKLRQQFLAHAQKFPVRFMEGVHNEDVLGNYLTNCKNAQNCFDSRKLWDCSYVTQAFDSAKNCMDCTEIGDEVELLYECYCMGYNGYNNKFCTHQLGGSTDLTYCYFTPFCKDSFGCVGQHHGRYRIFNKQYPKEAYFELKDKIIAHMKSTGEWGEFFPTKISPYPYNLTIAAQHFPLTRDQALEKGYNWRDEEESTQYDGPKYEIPKNIEHVPSSICDQILACSTTGKNYRIVKPELEFYRKMNLPIPSVCPDERHKQRMALRNPRTLYDRACGECEASIQTTFSPERPEKVLCEGCYLKVIN